MDEPRNYTEEELDAPNRGGLTLRRLIEVTGSEYPNVFRIEEHINDFTPEERQALAEDQYAGLASLTATRWHDWHCSSVFGGKRSGQKPAELRAQLEKRRLEIEATYGAHLARIDPCNRAYIEARNARRAEWDAALRAGRNQGA
jgi:hypothetical protein